MRADMHRVLASSRHRRGSLTNKVRQKGQARALARMPDDEQPFTESMSSRGGFRSRRQKYGVLKRFVMSQVGRPWADVFSEVCSRMDVRNSAQKEIREWIKRFVDEDIVLIDGVPFDRTRRWRVQGVWLHPETGTLMPPPVKARFELTAEQQERRRRWQRKTRHDYFKIDAKHRLVHVDDGGWFVVVLKPLPLEEPKEYSDWPSDVLSYGGWGGWNCFRHQQFAEWGDYVYAAQKRPASNKTIKRYSKTPDRPSSDTHVVMRPAV